MASLNTCGFGSFDENGTQNGVLQLEPSLVRNGLITVKGKESSATVLAADAIVQATLSVRPGKAADLINMNPRVKRKFVMKVRVPIQTPGIVANASGTVTDYIDVDLTVATPVEATPSEINTALGAVQLNSGMFGTTWVSDMLKLGNEPY